MPSPMRFEERPTKHVLEGHEMCALKTSRTENYKKVFRGGSLARSQNCSEGEHKGARVRQAGGEYQGRVAGPAERSR
jgi:hypothetical protein